MINIIRTLFFLLFYTILGSSASAVPLVIFETGGNTPVTMGKPVLVQSTFLQIQLSNSIVLSAQKGAEFLLDESDGRYYRLHMGKGNATVADLSSQQVFQLNAGLWLIPSDANSIFALPGYDERSLNEHSENRYRQGFHFDDYIMLRQQSYLNSLTIPISTINNWLAAFLGNLIGPAPSR